MKAHPSKNRKEQWEKDWLKHIKLWYPNFCSQTYFIPPLLPEALQSTLAVRERTEKPCDEFSVPENKRRGTLAMTCILRSLQRLTRDRPEGMMVLSQLPFGKYLHNPSYTAAAIKFAKFPTLQNLKAYRQGDFDVLIIHKYGIITIEVKSIGANFDSLDLTEDEKETKVLDKMKQAMEQLKKAETVLRHLVKDKGDVAITKVLAMPNISSSQMTRALERMKSGQDEKSKGDKEDLFAFFDVSNITEATELCLTRDNMEDVEFDKWWETLFNKISKKFVNTMKNETYEEVVSRFCGPATMVEVFCVFANRLELKPDDTKQETWNRVTSFQLYPNQLEALVDPTQMVYLTGPPGTGKTIVLVLKALLWLQQGQNVQVVSTWYKSPASSYLIQHQATETFKVCSAVSDTPPRVNFYKYDFVKEGENTSARMQEVENAVRRLKEEIKEGQLCVITDEPGPDIREDALQAFVEYFQSFKKSLNQDEALPFLQSVFSLTKQEAIEKFQAFKANDLMRLGEFQKLYATMKKKNMFTVFCERLKEAVQNLYLWAATIEHSNIPEGLFKKRELTIALRSPSEIVERIKNGPVMQDGTTVLAYDEYSPVAKESWSINHLSHEGHRERLAQDCEECGEGIANLLQQLHVVDEKTQSVGNLQCRDVLVICEDVFDEKVDENGKRTPASGLVRGLRNCNLFPVRVVERVPHDDAIKDTALALSNKVTVSHYLHVTGLERKVVVLACDLTWENIYWELCDLSRSTAHVIFIDYNN